MLAKDGLAVLGENLGNAAALAGFDQAVDITRRHAVALRKGLGDGTFAHTGQANQCNGFFQFDRHDETDILVSGKIVKWNARPMKKVLAVIAFVVVATVGGVFYVSMQAGPAVQVQVVEMKLPDQGGL